MKQTMTITREFEDGDVVVMKYRGGSGHNFFVRRDGKWKLPLRATGNTWDDAQINNFLDIQPLTYTYFGNLTNTDVW